MIHDGSLIDINPHYQTAQIIAGGKLYRPFLYTIPHLPTLSRVESTKTLEWPFSQLIFEIESDRRALHPEDEGEERQSTERVQWTPYSTRSVSPHIYCIAGNPRPVQQPLPVARARLPLSLPRPHLICRIKKLRASAAECGDPSNGSQTGSICDLFLGGRECAVHTKVLAPMLMNCRDSPPHCTALLLVE